MDSSVSKSRQDVILLHVVFSVFEIAFYKDSRDLLNPVLNKDKTKTDTFSKSNFVLCQRWSLIKVSMYVIKDDTSRSVIKTSGDHRF